MGDLLIERLYYTFPSADAADAIVLRVGAGGRELVLDRTLFFPEGGGQPCDLGTIDGMALVSVLERDGEILHRLAEPSPATVGSRVALLLDRSRRRDHGEQHSAQHLLSGLLFRNHGIPTRSFHLGAERSTIDVDIAEFSPALCEEIEDEVNQAIALGLRFTLHLCPPEDLATLPLRREPPEGEESLRIWEIEGLDFSPCCGAHVASSAELRFLRLHAAERYKGMTRLHFSAGGRAVADSLRVQRAAARAGRILSSPPSQIDEGAEGATVRLREANARAGNLVGVLARRSLELLGQDSVPFLDLSGTGDQGIEEGLRALREAERGGVVFVSESSTVALIAPPGHSLPDDLGAVIRGRGGKGGGSNSSFRAKFSNSGQTAETAAELRRILSDAAKKWELRA